MLECALLSAPMFVVVCERGFNANALLWFHTYFQNALRTNMKTAFGAVKALGGVVGWCGVGLGSMM